MGFEPARDAGLTDRIIPTPPASPPDELPRLNCKAKVLPAFTQVMSSIQVIVLDPKSGALWGAGDPRADGVAFGY